MPICIECRYPVKTLYTEYSKADDRALGKGVRLTQCPRCKRFADKYVEHDFVVLFIDLVLIKAQVYRHLLFNRLGRDDDKFDRSILRLSVLLLLFDVYLTWARIEKLSLPLTSPHNSSSSSNTTSASTTHNDVSTHHTHHTITNALVLQAQPLILQYFFFLLLVTTSTLAFHLPIRLLCSWHPSTSSTPTPAPSSSHTTTSTTTNTPSSTSATSFLPKTLTTLYTYLIPHYPHPTPLSTALLVSSCTKLFPILLIIWDYDLPSAATAVSWSVIVNNIAALEILMDCGYLRAGVLVAVGAGLRSAVSGVVLRGVGLGTGWGEGVGGVKELWEGVRGVWEMMGMGSVGWG